MPRIMTITLALTLATLASAVFDEQTAREMERRNAEVVAAPGDVEEVWCVLDADCRTFGDAAATCGGGVCSCTGDADGSRLCQGVVDPAREVTFVVSYAFEGLDCQGYLAGTFSETFERSLKAFIASMEGFTLVSFNFACGSVIAVAEVSTTSENLDTGVATITTEVTRLQAEDEVLTTVPVTSHVSANPSQCVILNAVSTTLLEGTICFPTQCSPGYTLSSTTATPPVHSCVSSTAGSSDDSALTDLAIAGIIVGVLIGLGCIVFMVFFGISSSGGDEDSRSAKSDEEEATEPENNDVGGDHYTPNEPW